MPRKRRLPKYRPLPQALSQISLCERSSWACYGPLLATDNFTMVGDNTIPGSDAVLYHIWPTWTAWLEFYGRMREELYAARPWLRQSSAAEQLYQAWGRGEDLDAVRDEIDAERDASDPRRRMPGGPGAA